MRYIREFSKKFETVLMGYSGAGGKLIHKKTRSKKSRDTVPLKRETKRSSVELPIPRYGWFMYTVTYSECSADTVGQKCKV